jgi:acid phosphatase
MICLITGVAAGDNQEGREALHATLWKPRAPDYRAIAEQTYRLAAEKLAAPSPGSAAVEQKDVPAAVLARMPTAVVMDLDETVLDNTVYQARLLRDGTSYEPVSWGKWVMSSDADAVPGARDYIALARKLGHTVFFLSNRDCTIPAATADDPCPAKSATMNNLVTLGIDIAPDPDHLLLRRERPEWSTSAKAARRSLIASQYRIIALVGDDLGDFVAPKTVAGDRQRLAAHFGVDWFLLPNPIYGSWTAPFDTLEEKYAGLRTDDPVLELPGIGLWKDGATKVRIASWNVEYLVTPSTHAGLHDTCAQNGGMVKGDDRTLPCAITKHPPRTEGDYASLRQYAA